MSVEPPLSLPKKVAVTGATGFIGTSVCHALVAAGYEVIGLSRDEPKPDRSVGGVTYFKADVTKGNIPDEAFSGCGYIVHLVGIIAENRKQGVTFESVHVGGTRQVLRAAQIAKVSGRIIYVSAQGADPDASSEYSRTKAIAEQLVRKAEAMDCVILRPSLVIGPGGEFIKQMESLIRRPPLFPFNPPFIPVPGNGANKFQPVYVGDLADAVVRSLTAVAAENATIPVGGPDRITFNKLLNDLAKRIHVSKRLFHIPMFMMYPAAALMEMIVANPPITVDQLKNLSRDNICDNTALNEILKVYPLPFESMLDIVYPPLTSRKSTG
jgi:NADH dehydrogenase